MIGRTISHYEILEKLGEGGMGVVYKARDTKLDRTVAIKFLPAHLSADSEAKKRFVQEAKSASALDHPNICTIHEIDEIDDGATFIAMACYDGKTLREMIDEGPLEIAKAVDIVSQISSGLAKAHENGIVHRDIKPANIILTSDGHVKILDFGIAKLESATRMTREGHTLGTVAYMSPEQTRGEGVGPATDVWATGVILYEMLNGHQPFRGDYEQAVIYSILNEDPAPGTESGRDIPVSLQELLAKTLEKDPSKRYGSAGELKTTLNALATGPTAGAWPRRMPGTIISGRKRTVVLGTMALVAAAAVIITLLIMGRDVQAIDSLAVLPFENISRNEDHDIFAEGITGELISSFNKVGTFDKVISRASSMRYRGSDKPLNMIADELRVRGLVAGSIQIQGDDVHLFAELIDGESGESLWSNTFDGGMSDLFALQSRIAREIALEVAGSLTPEEEGSFDTERKVDPEAIKAYLWGIKYDEGWNTEGRVKAIESFEKAISIDSTFADAYSWLAFSHASGAISGNEDFDKAESHALKALELDPRSSIAHEALGWVLLYRDWDWEGAAEQMRIARKYSTGGDGIMLHGFYNMSGDEKTAVELTRRNVERDPLDPMNYMLLAYCYMCFQRSDEALAVLEEMGGFESFEEHAWEWSAYVYTQKGMPDSSLIIAEREGLDTSRWHLWDWVYGDAGVADSALRHLDQYEALYPHMDLSPQIAMIYSVTGDNDKAFEWLERAYENHNNWLLFMNAMSGFGGVDNLLDDPRWDDLTSRIGFPKGNWEKRRAELKRRQEETGG